MSMAIHTAMKKRDNKLIINFICIALIFKAKSVQNKNKGKGSQVHYNAKIFLKDNTTSKQTKVHNEHTR